MAMTPKRIAIPSTGAIYRGSDWELRIDWTWDVSAVEFAMNLAPTLNTDTGLITPTADNTHNDEDPAYTLFSLDVAVTEAIPTSVTSLEWDIRGDDDNVYYSGSIPVLGQVGAVA